MTNDNLSAAAGQADHWWQHRPQLPAPRTIALGALAATVPIATGVAFLLSYRGLVDFGLSVGVPIWLAWAYPLMFDLPIVAGEAVLFIAALDSKTKGHVTGWAWVVTIGFAVASAAGNAGLLPQVLARALPPIVLAILLGFGLGELKRQSPKNVRRSADPSPGISRPPHPKPSTARSTAGGKTSGHLDEVAERRAADRAKELLRDGPLRERTLAADPVCKGNRHMAKRAMATATRELAQEPDRATN